MPRSSMTIRNTTTRALTDEHGEPLPDDNRGFQIVKEVVLIGDKHEGFGRGSTGEFYDFFVIDDTTTVTVSSATSRSLIETELEAGNYRRQRRWVAASFNKAPTSGHLRARYELRERDESGDSAKVIEASSGLAKFVGTATGGLISGPSGAKAGGVIAGEGIKLVAALLKADDDDQVIADELALDRFANWGIGKYFQLRSTHLSRDSRCILSVRVPGPKSVSQYGYHQVRKTKMGTTSFRLSLPKSKQGALSLLWEPDPALAPRSARGSGTINIRSQAGRRDWRPATLRPSFENLIPTTGGIVMNVVAETKMTGTLSYLWTHESQFTE